MATQLDGVIFNGQEYEFPKTDAYTKMESDAKFATNDDVAKKIDDAPKDSKSYVRKNGQWEENKGGKTELPIKDDDTGEFCIADEQGKKGLILDKEGNLIVQKLSIVGNEGLEIFSVSKDSLIKIQSYKLNILILGDSYSQQGLWIAGMKKYIRVNSLVNLAVGSATVKDIHADRQTYPYTSRPKNTQNGGNLNVFACQVEKLKRLMQGTDLDSGEEKIYTTPDSYPNVIIIAGGQNDTPDTEKKENTYFEQFQKTVSDVYIKRTKTSTAEVGSCTIPTPLNEIDRTCFAGAYRYLIEELNKIFPKAQIFMTTRSNLSYWKTPFADKAYEVARQQRKVASIVSTPLIDWNMDGFINTITDHIEGEGTQQNPYVWAGTTNQPHTGDLLHPNAKGGEIYGQVAANAIYNKLIIVK